MEARQYDQPHRIEKGEHQAGATDGDGRGLGEPFDEGFVLTNFRDASEDRREHGEEHDNDSKPSVGGVSQGTTPQTDRRGEDDDGQGCTGYSTLENKG